MYTAYYVSGNVLIALKEKSIPPPPPLVTTNLFSVSMHLFLFGLVCSFILSYYLLII